MIDLSLPADASAVAAAVAAARLYAADLAEPAASRLAIIVEELVANLVDHAVHPAGAVIGLRLWRADGRVWLRLADAAAPFDPRTAARRPIPERGGSAGLAMVQAWSRIDSYGSNAGRNMLVLSLPLSG